MGESMSPHYAEMTLSKDCRPEESVRADLKTLRASALIKPGTKFVGLVYDLETGLLKEVE